MSNSDTKPASFAISPVDDLGFLVDLLSAIPDPVFVKDENHRWVFMNNPMCDFFKLPR